MRFCGRLWVDTCLESFAEFGEFERGYMMREWNGWMGGNNFGDAFRGQK